MNIKDLFNPIIMGSDPVFANKLRDIEIQVEQSIAELQVDITEARKAVEVLTRKVAQRDEKIRQLSTKGDARA